MFERILVPLDGSSLAEQSIPWAAEIGAAFDSELHLVSACETKVDEHRNMHLAYIQQRAEQASQMVAQRKQNIVPKVKSMILEGHPAEQVLDYAEKNDVGLLLLVSHGRSGLMPWPMGSTAARILERTGRPALFIRAQAEGIPSPDSHFSHIMVPLDGSGNSEAVLPYVGEIGRRLRSRVTLFHTIAPGYQIPTIGGLNYIPIPEAETDRLSNEARQYLDQVGRGLEGVQIVPVVRVGEAAPETIKFVGENNVSLVAMSSHGQTGAGSWSMGGITHKILHSGRTPLLLVKARGA